MSTINQLNQSTSINAGDLIPIWSTPNGTTQNISISNFAAYILTLLGGSDGLVTQYASPNASGFSVTIQSNLKTWLLLTPLAGYAAGTLVLPSVVYDQMEINVNSTQSITTLTISGGTVNGAPATLAANGFFRLRYDAISQSWYRIG